MGLGFQFLPPPDFSMYALPSDPLDSEFNYQATLTPCLFAFLLPSSSSWLSEKSLINKSLPFYISL